MPFTRLKLTTFGASIEAKGHQRKPIHFTRVAIGDGLLGNGSMINRTALISERHSMQIDGIIATDDARQSAVIATLDNRDLTEGFAYRELALMAKDPDTGIEGVYLYDNAGPECEFLDTQENGTLIYERIKILIRVEGIESITFDTSGNLLYMTAEEVMELLKNKADLGTNRIILSNQLPEMDFAPSVHAARHGAKGSDPITPGAIGAAPASHKHTKAQITDFPASMPASDVPAWAKAAKKPGYSWGEITGKPSSFAPAGHNHAASAVNSGVFDAARIPNLPAGKITSGTLPVGRGGTGVTTLAALAAALQSSGGMCKIQTGSYVGTGAFGASNPCSLTFLFPPKAVWITVSGDLTHVKQVISHTWIRGDPFGYVYTFYNNGSARCNLTWSGNTLSWYGQGYATGIDTAGIQMNTAGYGYYYAAIG